MSSSPQPDNPFASSFLIEPFTVSTLHDLLHVTLLCEHFPPAAICAHFPPLPPVLPPPGHHRASNSGSSPPAFPSVAQNILHCPAHTLVKTHGSGKIRHKTFPAWNCQIPHCSLYPQQAAPKIQNQAGGRMPEIHWIHDMPAALYPVRLQSLCKSDSVSVSSLVICTASNSVDVSHQPGKGFCKITGKGHGRATYHPMDQYLLPSCIRFST